MRTLTALGAVALALAAAPAAQAASLGEADELSGSGTEAVTFSSDPATCASFGRCGYSGTVTYTFRARHGFGFFDPKLGFAILAGTGATTASVTPPDGSAPCSDTVDHPIDELTSERGFLVIHDPKVPVIEYLATRCVGPLEADVLGGQPLYKLRLPRSCGCHGAKRLTGTVNRSFTASGFTGTVTGSIVISVKRAKR
jgi:hypothetical protein